jgi:hypothetical protein
MQVHSYPGFVFHQYKEGAEKRDGRLVAFCAPAQEIKLWAGVPRKGWTLRALYQRILDTTRISRVSEFFTPATDRAVGNLSPTAVTIALMSPKAQIPNDDGPFTLTLEVSDPPDLENASAEIARLAGELFPAHLDRLSGEVRSSVDLYVEGRIQREALECDLPQEAYVALFVADLVALSKDPDGFLNERSLDSEENKFRLLDGMYELSKPALIVDGQHRVFGAAAARGPSVSFLVCAIPHCSWEEQAFQFLVINEEAKPVDVTVLYDIFGSSLTRDEADNVRQRLGPAGKDVERRIAAVIAYRDQDSPFLHMVQLRVEDLPKDVQPYLSPRLIVDLIDGSRSCRGFRADPDFLRLVVRPTLHESEADDVWTSWYDGCWRQYWYAFWRAIRDYFNEGSEPLWMQRQQTNLTKGVSLKALQDVLLDEMVNKAQAANDQIERLREIGVDEEKIARFLAEQQLASSPDEFYTRIREQLLKNFPRGFFVRPWMKSLDTAAGMEALKTVLKETWSSYVGSGGSKKYPYWRNGQVFEPAPDERST